MCDECWERISGGLPAAKLVNAPQRDCCLCGNGTASGIMVRMDPSKTLCKGSHRDEETKKIERSS